jgi:hypothetical protein
LVAPVQTQRLQRKGDKTMNRFDAMQLRDAGVRVEVAKPAQIKVEGVAT